MSSATININPRPRRLLSPAEAAQYCNLPPKVFRRVCPVQPVQLVEGRQAYDMRDLDAWVDAAKAGGRDEIDDIVDRL